MTAARRTATRRRGSEPPLLFRGPPGRLSSLVPLSLVEGPGPLEVALKGADAVRARARALTRSGDGGARLRVRVPDWTPPGRYQGSVRVGEREIPVVAEVEPRPRVRADPPRLTMEAAPGEERAAEVTLLNTGNVPCSIPAVSRFCIFDGGGFEHAAWTALSTDPPRGKERIDLFMDDLAESHGGLVEVATTDRKEIAPGEARRVRVTLRFSDRLRPGRDYAGAWAVPGLRLPVRVTTARRRGRRR